MTYETLKGTFDSVPSEQIKINKVLDIIRKNFEKFGFRPFDTPIIEYFETLKNKYDENDEIVQEIFKVQDRGERQLGLRYDLTVPLCRYVSSQKQLKKPFRRYQIGKVFRDGPIKKGRLREFVQCDGDVIGLSGQGIEAELLQLFYGTYKELGINAVLEINNNKILKGALLQEGCEDKNLSSYILSIDKLKKIGEEGVEKEIREKGLDVDRLNGALKLFKLDSIKELEKKARNSILKEGVSELKELITILGESIEYRLNFSMARGLNIYTGNIWEAYDKQEKISSSLGSGGRYDNVIGEYSNSKDIVPALGISFGLVPILEVSPNEKTKEGITDLLIVPLVEEVISDSLDIANKFRTEKNVEMFYGLKMKKAFDYCDYLGIKEVIFIGKRDLENKEIVLKNLETKEEEKIKL